jgi:hypothetical protein
VGKSTRKEARFMQSAARLALPCLVFLTACGPGVDQPGNPLNWPVRALGMGPQSADYQQRRGAVELIVKSQFPAILNEIEAGDGPVLRQAMDTARIPLQDRPARIIQLQSDFGLYEVNPGALVAALMLYGG